MGLAGIWLRYSDRKVQLQLDDEEFLWLSVLYTNFDPDPETTVESTQARYRLATPISKGLTEWR